MSVRRVVIGEMTSKVVSQQHFSLSSTCAIFVGQGSSSTPIHLGPFTTYTYQSLWIHRGNGFRMSFEFSMAPTIFRAHDYEDAVHSIALAVKDAKVGPGLVDFPSSTEGRYTLIFTLCSYGSSYSSPHLCLIRAVSPTSPPTTNFVLLWL